MACNGGKQPVFAFGDFNIPADVLRDSGMLEALGLEIVIPADGQTTCTAGKGALPLITWCVLKDGVNSSTRAR